MFRSTAESIGLDDALKLDGLIHKQEVWDALQPLVVANDEPVELYEPTLAGQIDFMEQRRRSALDDHLLRVAKLGQLAGMNKPGRVVDLRDSRELAATTTRPITNHELAEALWGPKPASTPTTPMLELDLDAIATTPISITTEQAPARKGFFGRAKERLMNSRGVRAAVGAVAVASVLIASSAVLTNNTAEEPITVQRPAATTTTPEHIPQATISLTPEQAASFTTMVQVSNQIHQSHPGPEGDQLILNTLYLAAQLDSAA